MQKIGYNLLIFLFFLAAIYVCLPLAKFLASPLRTAPLACLTAATVDTMEDSEATPRRVIDLNSRNLHTSSPSPSPSPFRLWRPAAQRNIRNQWSKLLSAKDRWLSASSDGKLHATSVVNAFLSQRRVIFSYFPELHLFEL